MRSSTSFHKWGAGTYWCWRQARNPWGGGGDKNKRTARAENDRKEVKTTSENSLTNRPYSRYPPSLNAGFRIDGIKAMSRDISGGNKRWNLAIRVIADEFLYSIKTRRRFWSCKMFSSSFDKFYVILSTVATASIEVTMITSTHNLQLLSLR